MIFLLGCARGLHLAGFFTAFGTILFTAWLGPAPGMRRLAWAGGAVALGAGAVWFLAQTADFAAPRSWAAEAAALPVVAARTRFGFLLPARLAALALALVLYQCGFSRAALLPAGAGALAEAWLGHGAAMLGSTEGDVLFAGALIHIGAAACWLGTLPALWLALGRLPGTAAAPIARRYSRLGMGCVAALLLTALLYYLLLIGGIAPLFTTAYGLTALAKLVLLGLLIALAARNKHRLTPALPATGAALRRAVAWECALGLAVLLAAGLLMQQAPPAMMDRNR